MAALKHFILLIHTSRKHRGMDIESEARKCARTEEISSDLDEDALSGDNSERGLERGDNGETGTDTIAFMTALLQQPHS